MSRSIELRALFGALCLALAVAATSRPSLAATGPAAPAKAKKHRCHRVRSHGRRHRVCKKNPPPKHPEAPAGQRPVPSPPGAPTPPGGAPQPEYHEPGEEPGREPVGEPGTEFERVDLVADPGFEGSDDPIGCFASNGADGELTIEGANPIADAQSLHTKVRPFGRVGCFHEYGFEEGPTVRLVKLEGDIRIDAPSDGEGVKVCAIVYFEGNQVPQEECKERLPLTDHGVVHVVRTIEVDKKRIQRAFFQLEAGGREFEATIDNAHLIVEQAKGSEGPRGGHGGGGGGGGGGACAKAIQDGLEPVPSGPPAPSSPCNLNATPNPSSTYVPGPLTLPPQRPFISLADYTSVPEGSVIFQKFKGWVDDNVFRHSNGYLYSSTDAVIMYGRTHNAAYIDDAIARVDAEVRAAEARIAKDEAPQIAHDSYLDVGGLIEELALAYDYGIASGRLTQDEQDRWKAYGDQAIANIWNPLTATWGSHPVGAFEWSAWAIDDPGNNYNFSFMKATQMWALATRSQAWFDFLQRYKFPLTVDYYAQLPGGGSREGTGYGGSQRELWENARMWRGSTGEALPTIRKHARESIDYWVNATVPTLDFFAPIGDLSRQSLPELFDYQENLLREAVMAAPGTEAARHGLWSLTHNSVPDTLTQGFTLRGALLTPPDTAQEPTALSYYAPGVGQLFARSSWSTDATWMQFTGGPYDQSHAHEDQGAFTFYRGTWLAVTSNIWSFSGLQGGGGGGNVGDLNTGVNNLVRFDRPGQGGTPQTIRQNFSDNPVSVDSPPGGAVTIHADLSNAYSDNSDLVHSWKRDLVFQGNELHVHDTCSVDPGVTPTFQLNVPVKPTDNGGGSITAGKLQVNADPDSHVNLVDMTSFTGHRANEETGQDEIVHEFDKGWRIDITRPTSCEFNVSLKALP
jgi:hypothetical protein